MASPMPFTREATAAKAPPTTAFSVSTMPLRARKKGLITLPRASVHM